MASTSHLIFNLKLQTSIKHKHDALLRNHKGFQMADYLEYCTFAIYKYLSYILYGKKRCSIKMMSALVHNIIDLSRGLLKTV